MSFTDFQLIVAVAVFVYMFFRILYLKDSISNLNMDIRHKNTNERHAELRIQQLTIQSDNLEEIIEEYHNKESK